MMNFLCKSTNTENVNIEENDENSLAIDQEKQVLDSFMVLTDWLSDCLGIYLA